jgi:hypothetical protein
LTKDALTKINLKKHLYTILTHKDGLCFLRTIISEAQLDTIGTVESYRRQLNQLPIKMVEMSSNIKYFHQHVNTVTGALDFNGMAYPELILNLFEAYEKVEDAQFDTYIMVTRFGYIVDPDPYDPRMLMIRVENPYKMRVQARTWQPALQNQSNNEIAALTAKIDALSATQGQGRRTKGKDHNDRKGKNAWKYVVPRDGEPQSKMYDNRQYHWCLPHGYWTMHRPEQCRGIDFKPSNDKRKDDIQANLAANDDGIDKNNPMLKVRDALRALIESTNDEDS